MMSAIAATGAARFPLGQLVATRGALDAMTESGQSPVEFLRRHSRLEQGELSEADHQENLLGVDQGFRILSAYKTGRGVKLWVITEADRSATAIMLPSEY